MSLDTLAANTRAAAARLDHEWDERAIDWPLTDTSTVVEVGGYCGRWALQIADRYEACLFVFEPQAWAFEVCRAVLGDRAMVLPFGLGVEDGYFTMGEHGTDGCSFLKDGGAVAACQIKNIGAAFADLDITRIDLMLVNIEGYEYTLIPYMLDLGIHPQRLMVQFHPFTADQKAIQAQIYERLHALGYTVAWSYGVILTAWERAA